MKMTFNMDTQGICLIFESLLIHSALSMVLYCMAVFVSAVLYEYLRHAARQLDHVYRVFNARIHRRDDEEHVGEQSRLRDGGEKVVRFTRSQQLVRSAYYGVQVFLAFMLMLVFMTYNGYLMASVVLGSAYGYFWFAVDDMESSKNICH
jgi:copper transporter 1